VVLTIDTNDAFTAEQIHLQVLEDYERTGSLELALQNLQQSPWRPELYTVVDSSMNVDPTWPLAVEPSNPSWMERSVAEPLYLSSEGKRYEILERGLMDTMVPNYGTVYARVAKGEDIRNLPDGRISVTFTYAVPKKDFLSNESPVKEETLTFVMSAEEASSINLKPGERPEKNYQVRRLGDSHK
jgi:hypothetical protein